ncbi:MAG: sporulation protein [Methylophilaceae bacterium]|jgi:DedD protein|nr:sporulation protein [Methylophilaceae bacterium]
MAQDNSQPESDQELQFKKRARRRLVGAVALVLLMIILLPMVLEDRTAQTPKEDIVISIPSQDTQTLDNKAPDEKTPDTPAASQAVAPAPIQQEVAPSAPANNSVAANANVAAETNKPTPAEVTAKPEAPKPEAPKVEPTKAATADNASDAKTEDKKPESTGTYYVQVGVFSDPDNVKQMQDKLSTKGLKSRTELIDTAKGKKTRLRVGPFNSKKDAEGALEKMKSVSLTGMIVSAS